MSRYLDSLKLFAVNSSQEFGQSVAYHLDIPLANHEEREFEDGEHKIRSLVNVRNQHVFVIQSLYSDEQQSVNDKLCRLLFFIGSLRDASAANITAVIPYLSYARKDQKSQPRDPVTTRHIASLLEAVGTDRVITLDVHNLAAFQNAFRCKTENLEAQILFVDHLAPKLAHTKRIVVVSPDVGGVKRADKFRNALGHALNRELPTAFLEKARAKGELTLGRMIGDVEDATAIIIDDLIASGSTLVHAAESCKQQGANQVIALASHGVFVGDANDKLASPAIDRLIITDSIPPFRITSEQVKRKLTVLTATKLFGEAIRCVETGDSIVELLHR